MAPGMKIGGRNVLNGIQVSLSTQNKPLLFRISQKPLTERGLQKESRISLWTLTYEKIPQASVFVYPADYNLTSDIITEIDGKFSGDPTMREFRQFKDMSCEDLDSYFIRTAYPLHSIFDHNYKELSVFEHSFSLDRESDLKKAICLLKGRELI